MRPLLLNLGHTAVSQSCGLYQFLSGLSGSTSHIYSNHILGNIFHSKSTFRDLDTFGNHNFRKTLYDHVEQTCLYLLDHRVMFHKVGE